MRYFFLPICIISSFFCYSQDVIIKKDGTSIESKIEEIGIEKIKYLRHDYLTGPTIVILKSDVSKIAFEDGTVQLFESIQKYAPILLEETKNIIVEIINKYGYEHAYPHRDYKASIEGDYLRLTIPNVFESKKFNEGHLYDFSEVFAFHPVSKRSRGIAYINIWVLELRNKKKNTWYKKKLVIRVLGYNNAEMLLDNLKKFNNFLSVEK